MYHVLLPEPTVRLVAFRERIQFVDVSAKMRFEPKEHTHTIYIYTG